MFQVKPYIELFILSSNHISMYDNAINGKRLTQKIDVMWLFEHISINIPKEKHSCVYYI